MTETETDKKKTKAAWRRAARKRWRRRQPWWVAPVRTAAWALAIGFIVVFGTLAITGRPLSAPEAVVRYVERQANAQLSGTAQIKVGNVEVLLDQGYVPRVRLTGVQVMTAEGGALALIGDLRASFDGGSLLRGRIVPESFRVVGAELSLRRGPDGRIAVPEGLAASDADVAGRTPTEVVDAVEAAFGTPALSKLMTIEGEDLRIRLLDEVTGRTIAAENGKLSLVQTVDEMALDLTFQLAGTGMASAPAQVNLVSSKKSSEARLEVELRDISARDAARQSPALSWLGVLDAPISGRFVTEAGAKGEVASVDANLTIGAGALRPNDGVRPIGFRNASVDLHYDPAVQTLTLKSLALDSPQLRVKADGVARLKSPPGRPQELVTQIAIRDLAADPEGVFVNPVVLSGGAADLKIVLDPLTVQLGQLVLFDGERRIAANGRISADTAGWSAALDIGTERIDADRLLALWPVAAVPKTRAWLAENVATAELTDVRAAFRGKAGEPPRLTLGYNYDAAEVRFLRTLPPIRDGRGYAAIEDVSYTLVLDKGYVNAPAGGQIDVSGSVLKVLDIWQKPATAEVTLKTNSDIPAALSLLDEPPFRFLTKAGQRTDAATGTATLVAKMRFALKPRVAPNDVTFDVTGALSDVRSDKLVPGRVLTSDSLTVHATNAGMSIGGAGRIDDVPFDGEWFQRFGKENVGQSRFEGTVTLSTAFLNTFRIALPEGWVSGSGPASVALDLRRGDRTRFVLTSALNGLGLKIPVLGWSKPASREGSLRVEGTLGAPPTVDRLELSASDLTAKGRVDLQTDGSLKQVALDDVSIGRLFDGPLDIIGQGRGKPVRIAIRGGTADLRGASFSGGKAAAGPIPLAVRLDRLRVSDSITLTDFEGDFTTKGGFNGQFTGRVNGGAGVVGTAVPSQFGTAFRLRSQDAGGVMGAAGIFAKGRGGSLNMTLVPDGNPGGYAGEGSIKDIRVTDAPILAELLGVISVVGLLEQLNGQGILFSDAQAKFRIGQDAVQIADASAVGASLGISAEGTYVPGTKALAMEGTISPVYLLNGIGQIFSRRREGLFGFNYRLTGSVDNVRVSVNPLSIFTPGMFREIFRSDPPRTTP